MRQTLHYIAESILAVCLLGMTYIQQIAGDAIEVILDTKQLPDWLGPSLQLTAWLLLIAWGAGKVYKVWKKP